MKRAAGFLRIASFAGVALLARAAEPEPTPAPEPIVRLPPMIVSDTAGGAKWLYASVRGDEYLSRCSRSTTVAFVASWSRALERLHAVVPDAFLADIPSVTVLNDSTTKPKADDQVAREVLRLDNAMAQPNSRSAVGFLPNLELDGRDLSAWFAYIDEGMSDSRELAISPPYLRFLLERRTPMLPPWLVEGLLVVNAQVDVRAEAVTLRPFIWLSSAESSAIARNPARPRALLPAGEMFAPDALRAEGDHHPQRVQTLRTQVGLFVRWALDPRHQAREAFWAFAQRASAERVTEELFIKNFGFGFSDLRDRLSDYLPLAVKEPLHLEPRARTKGPRIETRDATPAEISRLRGTWERLEIAHVQKFYPEYAARYIAQARRTLRRPYEEGDKDPRLLVELGLCEIDAGNSAAGLPFLEAATAAAVPRPSAYYEVARLRFLELMRDQSPNRLCSAAEIAPVVEPLRRAIKLPPQLPEVFGLLADTWIRARESAPAEDVEALARAAHYFAMNPAVSYRIALALARSGRRAEATELLAHGIDYVADDAGRIRYAQLQAALTKPEPAPR